ncbi:Uncharacterised protein [Serratia proteamaculans]|nr:Uncharacterised protein [Serratia proteamaculans]
MKMCLLMQLKVLIPLAVGSYSKELNEKSQSPQNKFLMSFIINYHYVTPVI